MVKLETKIYDESVNIILHRYTYYRFQGVLWIYKGIPKVYGKMKLWDTYFGRKCFELHVVFINVHFPWTSWRLHIEKGRKEHVFPSVLELLGCKQAQPLTLLLRTYYIGYVFRCTEKQNFKLLKMISSQLYWAVLNSVGTIQRSTMQCFALFTEYFRCLLNILIMYHFNISKILYLRALSKHTHMHALISEALAVDNY